MASLPTIRIGTRKSALALAQAGDIRQRLLAAWPALREEDIALVHITTSGDRFTDQPLADIGGKGLFTKEIEDALLDGSIDLAVHSIKDMQTVLPEGLIIGCVPEREDPRDTLIGATSLAGLPKNATFGTSSLRRSAQALMQRPDLMIVPLRGNVETRLAKLQSGLIRATMLAQAGLNRLGLKDIDAATLPISDFLPAVGQGAVGVECRENDTRMRDLLAPLSHAPTEIAVRCERAFLRAVDGSCRMPIAGYAAVSGGNLQFDGLLIDPDGSRPRRVTLNGKSADAESIGLAAGKKIKG